MMFSDDGFGPAVADFLCNHYIVPKDFYIMDVGTGVRKLLFTLALSQNHPQEIVIVDAVDWGQSLGEVLEISVSQLPVSKIDDFSLHQVPTSNLLHDLQELCGIKVIVVACDIGDIPKVIQPGLSPLIADSVTTAADKIARRYGLHEKSYA